MAGYDWPVTAKALTRAMIQVLHQCLNMSNRSGGTATIGKSTTDAKCPIIYLQYLKHVNALCAIYMILLSKTMFSYSLLLSFVGAVSDFVMQIL